MKGNETQEGFGERSEEEGETIHYQWKKILDRGSLPLRRWAQTLHPVLLRTQKVLHGYWQVSGKSPVVIFRGKNWSVISAAFSLWTQGHWECEYLADCRVHQLVLYTNHFLILLASSSHVTTVRIWNRTVLTTVSLGGNTKELNGSDRVCHFSA